MIVLKHIYTFTTFYWISEIFKTKITAFIPLLIYIRSFVQFYAKNGSKVREEICQAFQKYRHMTMIPTLSWQTPTLSL